ncbi:MAG: hypothetical protein Kow00105_12840 [Phycisphaeraceae bacterium]
MACHLGEVVDISKTGVRIRCKGKPPFAPGSITPLQFAFTGGMLRVTAQERWRKRVGLCGGYEIGLMFVKNSPNVIAAIESLVKFGFICPDAVDDDAPKTRTYQKNKPKLSVAVELPDYYKILQIAEDADENAIHAAYRKLARQYHPDTNKSPDAQDRFIHICNAYKVLSDPEQRRTYDLRRAG